MIVDEMLAALVRTSGLSLDTAFLLAYLTSLVLIWTALFLIGTRLYRSPWAVAALAAAFTMRHRIPRTSVNSFEPYFSPRMLAFGIGALAIAAILRHRPWIAILLIGLAALVHVTTALWFAVLIGVALAVLDVRLRRVVVAGGAISVSVLAGMVMAGPLTGTITAMDSTWLEAVASKDSLFATDWPWWAWAANLGMFGLLWWAHHTRRRRGETTPEDEALVWGAGALVVLFLITLPPVVAGISLAVQFQISRVFWLVDLLALIYLIGAICDSREIDTPAARPRERGNWTTHGARRGVIVALVLLGFAAGRGLYVMLVERPERSLFEVHLPDTPWEDVMNWLSLQPVDTHVLADPGHSWKYGTSVRVSAERDVLLEEVKDSALAIYSRDVADRLVERTRAIGDFTVLSEDHARELARRYDLDFLVIETDLDLPIVYRNTHFRIYSLQ